jgi:anaerobic selenocysteine-containing dehydrogenase
VQLAPPALVAASVGLERAFERELAGRHELRLVGRRSVMTQNWWTHNHQAFVRGDRDTNHLYLHPDDAGRLGIDDGDLVDVTSATASVRLPARLDPDLMPETVSMPHGYGHQAAPGQRVASRLGGVNFNLLAPSGPAAVERLSGMARLTGIPVTVTPAASALAADRWSGRPRSPAGPGS